MNNHKLIIILLILLAVAAIAQAQDKIQPLPNTAKIPDNPLFHISEPTPSEATHLMVQIMVYKNSQKVVDTVYDIKNNKPYRTIHTSFTSYPDKKQMSCKMTTVWNDKTRTWDFDAVTFEPSDTMTGYILRGTSNSLGWPLLK